VIERLDTWVEDWMALWSRACVAEPEVRRCLEDERARFEAVLALLGSGPPGAGASAEGRDASGAARALVTELGSPLGCLDETRLPSLDVDGITQLAELSAIHRRLELAVLTGSHDRAAEALASFDAMLERLGRTHEQTQLALHRLRVEPLRARVLVASGDARLARERLRLAVREAEVRGHDNLRFALLLEQTRLAADLPSLDDLAMLEGLAERVEAGPVARAELALLQARASSSSDPRQLGAVLERAGAELTTPRQPQRYAELRFDLALRRAELYFEAGELDEASDAAQQAWSISQTSFDASGSRTDPRWTPRLIAALRIAGISTALRGDCDRLGPIVEALGELERSGVELTVAPTDGHEVDWPAVRRTCQYYGTDLQVLLGPPRPAYDFAAHLR
jgi:tetratricopeptide (TPR) repeat protein